MRTAHRLALLLLRLTPALPVSPELVLDALLLLKQRRLPAPLRLPVREHAHGAEHGRGSSDEDMAWRGHATAGADFGACVPRDGPTSARVF